MTRESELSVRLAGTQIPSVVLHATDGSSVDLSKLNGISVLYAYPRTGPPEGAAIPGWEEIPGAKGCTPQSCGFRDHHHELVDAGAERVFGLSIQDTAYQREVRERLHLPFEVLSDEDFALTDALDLPTFTAGGMRLLERWAMIVKDGVIEKLFHPVTSPAENAQSVLEHLYNPT